MCGPSTPFVRPSEGSGVSALRRGVCERVCGAGRRRLPPPGGRCSSSDIGNAERSGMRVLGAAGFRAINVVGGVDGLPEGRFDGCEGLAGARAFRGLSPDPGHLAAGHRGLVLSRQNAPPKPIQARWCRYSPASRTSSRCRPRTCVRTGSLVNSPMRKPPSKMGYRTEPPITASGSLSSSARPHAETMIARRGTGRSSKRAASARTARPCSRAPRARSEIEAGFRKDSEDAVAVASEQAGRTVSPVRERRLLSHGPPSGGGSTYTWLLWPRTPMWP